MKKKHLKTSFALSFLTHILFLGVAIFLAYFAKKEISIYENGGGKAAIWIDLEPMGSGIPGSADAINKHENVVNASEKKIEKETKVKTKSTQNDDALKLRQNKIEEASLSNNSNNTSSEKDHKSNEGNQREGGGGNGQGSAPGQGEGSGKGSGNGNGEGSSSSVLALIRSKIERSKHYPLLAKTRKIEGVAVLSFSINSSGRIDSLSLVQSSGSDLLDSEALATVRRAEPLPYYSKPIKISIRFNLQ